MTAATASRRNKSNRRNGAKELADKAAASALSAGLRYVSDEKPGISRNKKAGGFTYADAKAKPARPADLERIRKLVIPPAWRDVWISPHADGHLQATGRDERGRKQYRYHERWRQVRDETKYEKMLDFVQTLPKIRSRVRRDLARPGLPREKVLATVVRLLETTLIRVGNDEYATQNQSFGLTTLKDRHAKISASGITFRFKGKSGVAHDISLNDRRLAKIVRQCQALPGEELLQYVDEKGKVRDIGSGDVNDYLRSITGQDFTAKDFRTWAGTVLAATALKAFEEVNSQAKQKKNIVQAIESVAKRLGNTRAVCKKCYIHPAVLESYVDGSMLATVRQRAGQLSDQLSKLRPEEAAVVMLLQNRLTPRVKSHRSHSKRVAA